MQVPIKKFASPLNYTGGKYKLLSQLLPIFPDSVNTFVDLFCGGCNVAINVNAANVICNDIDSRLIGLFSFFKANTYDFIISRMQDVIKDFKLSDSKKNGYAFYNCTSSNGLSSFNRYGYLQLREEFNSLSPESENYYLYLYVLIVFSFNNQIRFNGDGKFNLPVGKRDFNIKMQNKLKSFFMILDRKSIVFTSKDFERIKSEVLTENDFVYVDPPYLITCATYNEKSWNEEEEKRLLSYLDNLNLKKIRFALSNVLSTDGKTNEILKFWLDKNNYMCYHLDFSYKNSSYHKKNISKTDEVLITNY